jgi:hypothetical protein
MEMNFDIFKRLRNGRPVWITSVPEIEEARVREIGWRGLRLVSI